MEALRHLLHPRLFQPLLENGQTFVQGHTGLEEGSQLFGKEQKLPVRNLQVLGRRRSRLWSRRYRSRSIATFGSRQNGFDLNRDAPLLFDLPDGYGSVGTIE